MSVRSVPALAAAAALAAACEVASGPDVPSLVGTAAPQEACAPAEPVTFGWSLEPVPEDISLELACVLGEPAPDGETLALPLACDEPGGPRTRTLTLWASPAPPTAALHAGAAVRLRAVWPDDGTGARDTAFVRLEAATGALLVAAATAGALQPPDGSDPWLPFTLAPAAGACLSEESACGETGRAAVDLRRAGGAPRVIQDASHGPVGDRGEAQLWVAAALRGDPACLGPTGAWYEIGLIAAR
jgi:hypothetical protein